MFPFLQQLKLAAGLKSLRHSWGATGPRYHYLYAVSGLLEDLAQSAGRLGENGEGPRTQRSFSATFLLPVQRH